MSQSTLFSSGSELGNLAVTSGVLSDSWDVNSALYREINNAPSSDPVRFKIDKRPNCNIIAFVTWPPCTKEKLKAVGAADFVSSSALKDTLPLFEFLCSKSNPCFSINKLAVECFKSLHGVLPFLKSEVPLALCPENSLSFIYLFAFYFSRRSMSRAAWVKLPAQRFISLEVLCNYQAMLRFTSCSFSVSLTDTRTYHHMIELSDLEDSYAMYF